MKRQRKRPSVEEAEVHRTDKGRILLDPPTGLYTVWLRRPDGTELELEQLKTRFYDMALVALKDTPAPGALAKR